MVANRLTERAEFLKSFQSKVQSSFDYEVILQPSNCAFIQVPAIITLSEKDPGKKNLVKGQAETDKKVTASENQIPFTFLFKNPVRDFHFSILLRNAHLTDVRIFRVRN